MSMANQCNELTHLSMTNNRLNRRGLMVIIKQLHQKQCTMIYSKKNHLKPTPSKAGIRHEKCIHSKRKLSLTLHRLLLIPKVSRFNLHHHSLCREWKSHLHQIQALPRLAWMATSHRLSNSTEEAYIAPI